MIKKKTPERQPEKAIMTTAKNAAKAFRDVISNCKNIDRLTLEDMALEALLHVKSNADIEGLMIEDDVIQLIRKTLTNIAHMHGVEIMHAPAKAVLRFGGPVTDPRFTPARRHSPVHDPSRYI